MVTLKIGRTVSGRASRFLGATDGVMTILALFFFVILVGMGGLAIDIGRVYGLRGQMVAYVDQVALASASELDGQTGAVQRAYRVALGDTVDGAQEGPLVSTSYNFAETNNLGLNNLIFLSSIASGSGPTPESGDVVVCAYQDGTWSPTGCNNSNTIDEETQFVAVTSTPLSVSYFVLPIANFFLGTNAMADTASLQMQATAGYKQEVCDLTPLMICNPSEPTGNTDTKYPFTPTVGEQILMKASGNSAWAPGDFGLLSEPSDAGGSCKGNQHGAGFITCMLALVNPLSQCVASTVNVKPGQAETTTNGFNARFDVYAQSAGKFSGNSLFAPSVDVTKGIVGNSNGNGNNSCPNQFQSAGTSVPLPRDANLKADSLNQTIRFGTGVSYTDVQTYWSTNHPGITIPQSIQTACQTTGDACRYTIYRYEIDNSLIPEITNGENGNPTCTTPGVNNSYYDRRTLIMAVINCHADGLTGMNNGTNMPVVAFVKMFMTEPAGLQEDATGKVTGFSAAPNIYGEVVGEVSPGDLSGVVHDLPVLYR